MNNGQIVTCFTAWFSEKHLFPRKSLSPLPFQLCQAQLCPILVGQENDVHFNVYQVHLVKYVVVNMPCFVHPNHATALL